MKSILTVSLLLVGLGLDADSAPTPTPQEKAVILHLKGGQEVSGVIEEESFDEAAGLTLRRDDNGGKLPLVWSQIRDEDVLKIKRMYGFEGDERPPIQLAALRIKTPTGDLIGIDAGRDAQGNILLRKRGVITPVPPSSVRSVKTELIDALDLEDPNEVYQVRRSEIDPQRAVDWYNLALDAEALTLYEQAKQDLETCLEIDPSFSKRDLIRNSTVPNLDVKIKEREETEHLLKIRKHKLRKQHDDALALVDEFMQRWPSSRQRDAVLREQVDITKRRRAHLAARIRTDFFTWLRREVEIKARDRELSLGEALRWAEDEAPQATVVRLATNYEITEEEVLDLWANRGRTGSPISASYGGGTFILGEKAREGYDRDPTEEEEEEGESTAGQEMSLQDKIQAALKEKAAQREKNNQKNDITQSIAKVPPTEEEWWEGAPPNERLGFLLAWVAEHAGRTENIRFDQRSCSLCGGKGVHEYFAGASGGGKAGSDGIARVPCTRCKTLGFDRIVKFR